MEPPLPEPREETGAASTGGRLYVIGGLDPAGNSTATTFYFDGGWHSGPRLPLGLDHPGVATVAGHIYVAGGFSGGRASARFFRLDGEAWAELAPMKRAAGALALVSAGDSLYALAGLGTAEIDTPEVFDPAGSGWHDLPMQPKPRNHVSGFSYSGLACIAGGRGTRPIPAPNTAAVNCFDPKSTAWVGFAALPFPTSGAGAGALGDQIIVAGGEDAQENRMVDQVARFRAGSWVTEKMLMPRHGFFLAPYQGRLWACGGGSDPGLHAVTTCTSIG